MRIGRYKARGLLCLFGQLRICCTPPALRRRESKPEKMAAQLWGSLLVVSNSWRYPEGRHAKVKAGPNRRLRLEFDSPNVLSAGTASEGMEKASEPMVEFEEQQLAGGLVSPCSMMPSCSRYDTRFGP
ncbi:hypothetical protein BT67DRAFT_192528 [Trichocladium antarcticum]|uniref:Uncharacterized protein n=1 Tax=Trichocladium antarcticum TaxID=1450529 RepID=A0AAN6ZFV0_9PEZI|nr:hypothetical protein BT67DRAFT_192528 [Trichocladium antarcticum]